MRSLTSLARCSAFILALSLSGACSTETEPPAQASHVAVIGAPPALATIDVAGEDGVRLEVVDATRPSPGFVELRLAIVNDGTVEFDLGDRWAAGPDELGAVSNLALAETDGQKRHFVLRDDQGRPLCSTGEAPVAPGERRELWARFGAPGSAVAHVRLVAGDGESADFGLPPAP